jgi:hypothetical protein
MRRILYLQGTFLFFLYHDAALSHSSNSLSGQEVAQGQLLWKLLCHFTFQRAMKKM